MEQIPAYQDAPFQLWQFARPLGETQTPHIGKSRQPFEALTFFAVIHIVAVERRSAESLDELGERFVTVTISPARKTGSGRSNNASAKLNIALVGADSRQAQHHRIAKSLE